jgi:predicted ATPase
MSAEAAAAAAQLLPTGDTGNKAKSIVLLAIAAVVIVIIIIAIKNGAGIFADIKGGIDKFLSTIGLKDSAEKEKANSDVAGIDPVATSVNSPFNPTFYKSAPAGTKLKTQGFLSDLATEIFNSVGYVYDDPEAGFAAIKQLESWAQVSQLSDKFNQLYKKDVYSWLKIKYDTTTQKDVLAKIVNYAVSLPKYT